MKALLSMFPPDIIQDYALTQIAHNNFIHMEIQKDMYGLQQARIIAQTFLIKNLVPFGYQPAKRTPELWKHSTRRTMCYSFVNHLGIKYLSKQIKTGLSAPPRCTQSQLEMSVDWDTHLY